MPHSRYATIDVRRIRTDEWEILRDLRLTMLTWDGRSFDVDPHVASAKTDAEWQAWCAVGAGGVDGCILVALADGAPIGMISADRSGTDADAGALWVEPTYRHRGVASQLLRALESWARSVGLARVVGGVSSENAAAHALYVTLGGVETGEVAPTRWGTTEIILAKDLQH